ncbi:hypothetical protein V5799_032553 [Amblyomma americanum]|uniref:Secreted protein n=1 Tax=Amblyomma americanum TaxID=6943 RepID=A0AAQ4DQU8_AMBAM
MKPRTLLAFSAFVFLICVTLNLWGDFVGAERVVVTTCVVQKDNEDCSRYKPEGKTCEELQCEKSGKLCCMKNCNTTHFCIDDPDIKP